MLLPARCFLVRRGLLKHCESRKGFKHSVWAKPFAQEYPLKGILTNYDSDQRENGGFCIGATRFFLPAPLFKVAGKYFDQFAKVLTDERIEVLIQLKGAVLQEPEHLRLVRQGLRKQFERTDKSCPSVWGLRDPGQQIAAKMYLLQLRFKYRNIQVVLAGIMAVNGNFIDLRGGGDVSGADAVVPETGKKIRRSCTVCAYPHHGFSGCQWPGSVLLPAGSPEYHWYP